MVRNGFFYLSAGFILFISGCGGSKGTSTMIDGGGSPALTAANPQGEGQPAGTTAPATGTPGSGDSGGAGAAPPASGQSVPPEPPKGTAPSAAWSPLAAPVHAGQAMSLSTAVAGGVLYLAWEELGKVSTAHWDGAQWKTDGVMNQNPNVAASVPVLAVDGEALYLSWVEDHSFYLAKREGGKWSLAAAPSQKPSVSGCAPGNVDLTVRQGIADVAFDTFCQDTGYVSTAVDEWSGSWVGQGGTGAHFGESPYHRKYDLRSNPDGLFLAVVTEDNASRVAELSLYHRTADGWSQQGGMVNDPDLLTPAAFSLAMIRNQPYLAFHQGTLAVKQWSGKEWSTVGAPIAAAGIDPYLTGVEETPYLLFAAPGAAAGTKSLQVSYWNGSAWTEKGSRLNQETDNQVEILSLSLGAAGNLLYAAWIENGSIHLMSSAYK